MPDFMIYNTKKYIFTLIININIKTVGICEKNEIKS